jgi:hypothetical protein
MRSGVARRSSEVYSGLGWAAELVGAVVLGIGILQAVLDHMGAQPVIAASVGMLLMMAGRLAIVVGRRDAVVSTTYVNPAGSIKKEALGVISVVGWILGAVGVLVLGLGIFVVTLGQAEAGVGVVAVGVILVLASLSVVFGIRRGRTE